MVNNDCRRLLINLRLGAFGNLLTIFAICNVRQLRQNHIHWFILSLCGSDFLFSVTILPLNVARVYYREWIFCQTICQVYAFLVVGNSICTVTNLVAITVNRYIKIVHFRWYPSIFTDTSVRIALALIWIGSFGFILPSLI